MPYWQERTWKSRQEAYANQTTVQGTSAVLLFRSSRRYPVGENMGLWMHQITKSRIHLAPACPRCSQGTRRFALNANKREYCAASVANEVSTNSLSEVVL